MRCLFLFGIFWAGVFASCGENREDRLWKETGKCLDFSVEQALRMAQSLADQPESLPLTFEEGKLKTCGAEWWTSGFFPGTLWYLYEHSHHPALKKWAEIYTNRLKGQIYNTTTHDLGFIIFCSFGNAYRITGDTSYRSAVYQASVSLANRFNPVVGCMRSWDPAPWNEQWKYPVLIDNMMNLELLMWSAEAFVNSTFSEVACAHAETTLKNHFRDDNSSYQVVSYDPFTGRAEKKQTFQGYNDASAWARGQAWGLYGCTMMYRETKDENYLQQAVRIADFMINHPNLPEDKIPYWDFNAPDIPVALRDASAASVMCSALLELCEYTDAEKSLKYRHVAERQLETLCSEAYRAKAGENGNFILKHSVGNFPGKTELDVPLPYTDYYFVEAMIRFGKMMEREKRTSKF